MNAKKEFIEHVCGVSKAVKCASLALWYVESHSDGGISLKIDYDRDEYLDFLEKINFEYDKNYGCKRLYGIIWYEDGTWSSREYDDGYEWWRYHETPEIPKKLMV